MISTLTDLLKVTQDEDSKKTDIEINAKDMRMDDSGKIRIGDESFNLTPWSGYTASIKLFRKEFSWTGLQKLPPSLKKDMFNYGFDSSKLDFVVRTIGDRILGVVSKEYKAYNNVDVVRALVANLGEKYEVHRWHSDDKFFMVRMKYPEAEFSVGEDTYHVGFTAVNSEVLFKSLSGTTYIHKLSGQNDAQCMENASMKMRHIGHSWEEMSNSLGESIVAGKELIPQYMDIIKAASSIDLPEREWGVNLEYVKNFLRASRKRMEEITQIFLNQPHTKMGLINSITSYAQNLRGDQRFNLESLAGSLLESTLPIER